MTTAEVRRILNTIAELGEQSRGLAASDEPEKLRASDRLHAAMVLCELAAFDLVAPAMAALSADNGEVPF